MVLDFAASRARIVSTWVRLATEAGTFAPMPASPLPALALPTPRLTRVRASWNPRNEIATCQRLVLGPRTGVRPSTERRASHEQTRSRSPSLVGPVAYR